MYKCEFLKKNVYIVLEIQSRELYQQLLLSTFLIANGYRVYIGDSQSIFSLLKKKNKGGILLNKGTIFRSESKLIKKKCDYYCVLDQELTPGFTDSLTKWQIEQRIINNTANFIDRYYVINDFIAKRVKKYFQKLRNKNTKVIATGWPKYDLYEKNFLTLFKKKIMAVKKKFKNYIIFNSNFGKLSEEEIAFDRKNLLNRYDLQKNAHVQKKIFKYKKDTLDDVQDTLPKVKNFLISLSKNFSKNNFLIRPHPGEYYLGWFKFCKQLKNFKVQKPKDDIMISILASSGILHRGCTSGYEATLLNRKSGYIKLTEQEKSRYAFRNILYETSHKIKNLDDFDHYCRKKVPKVTHVKKIRKLLNIDNKEYACEKILKDMNLLSVNTEFSHKDIKTINLNDYPIIFLFKKAIYDLLIFLRIKPERNKRYNKGLFHKFDNNFNAFFCKKFILQILKNSKFKKYKFKLSLKQMSNKLIEIDNKAQI
jgi:surface carbohydrate biosynthesis protein